MRYNNKFMKTAVIGVAVLTLAGCTGSGSGSGSSPSSATTNSQFIQAKLGITITGGGVNYSDSSPGANLQLQQGTTYTLNLSATGAPAGTSYTLTMVNNSQVNATPVIVVLQPGSNTLTVPAQGNWTLTLVASAQGYSAESKSYQAQVICATPTFTANSLNASAIAVSAGSGTNLYNYDATAVIAGANGQAPYLCAWDPTGTGIVDTAFAPCSQVVDGVYVNYVGTRNVGLIVQDACNIEYTVSTPVTLAYTEPSMPGTTFIFGQTSAAAGNAAGNPSLDPSVTYLATDPAGHKIVTTQYGGGSFDILAWQNYGMGSSVNFGMDIKLSGITDTIDVSAGTGSISAASATISSITYVTDQAGDQSPSLTFSGTNCTLSNQGAQVLFVSGQPCSGGTTGDQNNATVQVWGHYVCTGLSSGGGTVNISGDFDGYYDIADSCSGGGQGGGGVPPPGF